MTHSQPLDLMRAPLASLPRAVVSSDAALAQGPHVNHVHRTPLGFGHALEARPVPVVAFLLTASPVHDGIELLFRLDSLRRPRRELIDPLHDQRVSALAFPDSS